MNAESTGLQGEARAYTPADRRVQLGFSVAACGAAAALFGENGQRDLGCAYASLSDRATQLLAGDFEDADLRELGRSMPEKLPWMNPKYLDYNSAREPWQEAAAGHVVQAAATALELRAIATYDK